MLPDRPSRRLELHRGAARTRRRLRRLMTDIAAALEPGDLVTLSGDLGAGKTTFARALIRYLAGDDSIEVPSPTFTLMQTYELPRFPVVHADLYRLSGPAELAELGFDDLPDGRRGAARMARPRRRLPAARPARHRVHARAAARRRASPRPHHRLRRLRAARRAHRAGARASSTNPASARPSGSACRATPRRAPTSG